MAGVKQNVAAFDSDVRDNEGYRYTTRPPYSAVVANARINKSIFRWLGADVTSLIDVGCGDGTYTDLLKRARPDLRVAGLDPASEAISLARTRNPDIDFFVADILEAETWLKERFDCVLLRGVLHHLSDPAGAIRDCTRLSDRILIIEPNGNNPILKVLEKVSPYHREHEEQSFRSGVLSQWCRDAGLEIEGVEFIGFIPFFFPTILAKTIHFMQPALERVPLLARFFGAQIVISCRKGAATLSSPA